MNPLRRLDRRWAALARALEKPWFVTPEWLRPVRAAFDAGDRAQLETLVFGWGSAVAAHAIERGVGIVEIRGPLVQGFWDDYGDIARAVEEHARDPRVHAILLDIDSPGGVACGELWELAAEIRGVRERKRVVALANEQATSAAYVIAGAAREVYAAGPIAVTGSLGAIHTHVERSGWLKREGYGVSEIASGKHKTDLSQNKPLNADGLATIERIVEAAAGQLFDAVALGRGLARESIRAQEAAIFVGADALEPGLIDGVRTRRDLIDELANDSAGSIARGAFTRAGVASGGRTGASAELLAPRPLPDPIAAARLAGAEAMHDRAHEINTLCTFAGCPELAGDFIQDAKMTPKAVSDLLVRRRADESEAAAPEIDGRHTGWPRSTSVASSFPRESDADAIYERWNADARGARVGG